MGRNLLEVSIHFVWATWDRVPLVTPEIERDVYRYVSAVCRDCHCDVLAIGGMPDHLHLLVKAGSTESFAGLMQKVKGGSSRMISRDLRPGEWFQWQGSFSGFAVETRSRDRVIAYIGGQKRHHAEGTLWPALEWTSEEERERGEKQ